ncbi:MAG: LuxR C-terminal-related transcriptional regulator [Leptospira sp.]|nr:LuxR C-terminal-related transcriptional regulator [Leptospira sp.]
MSENNLKGLFNAFSNYVSLAQKAKGDSSTIEAKKNVNIEKFLTGFYSFDIFCYAIIDVTDLKILKFGGATQQLTGYDPDYFEGKSYYKFLKLHSVKDLLKSLVGGSKYFNYLYSQKKEKRPFIKSNRTIDLYKKNGDKIHVMVQNIPILFNSKMEVILFLIICTDISSLNPKADFTHYIIDTSDPLEVKKINLSSQKEQEIESITPSMAEKKVLIHLSEGLSSKQIADKLFLSEHTIKNHRKNMLKKYNCSSSSALIRKALLNGWI